MESERRIYGCFQNLEDEVDVKRCAELGVDIVRRRTGGGAVYHDQGGEITYSVIAPEGLMGQDITASYRQVCGWVMDSLVDLDLDPHYAPINDITVAGRRSPAVPRPAAKGCSYNTGRCCTPSTARRCSPC